MAMKRLLPTGNPQLVNYNFTDIAAATGYQTYYAGVASGANMMSNAVFDSDSIVTDGGLITSTAYIKKIDKDFDVLFNTPQNVRGTAIVSVPVGAQAVDATAGSVTAFLNIKIRRWDGTTETDIATGDTLYWSKGSFGGAGVFGYAMKSSRVAIPSTHFRKGEYLRLTVEVYARDQGAGGISAGNKHIVIFHDPANKAFNDGEDYTNALASGASILKLQLPLKIEV
jgi:hypothetical protein